MSDLPTFFYGLFMDPSLRTAVARGPRRRACLRGHALKVEQRTTLIPRSGSERGKDLSSALVARAIRDAGFDPLRVLREARSSGCKGLLRAWTAEAEDLSVFGAPTFAAGDELFWGDDRLEEALLWAFARHPAQRVA
ncbi:MAG TPA: DsbA family protein [Allosphingosinicella sp.]|jgi:2-hydroxychromene-2-carboxylate isomerase